MGTHQLTLGPRELILAFPTCISDREVQPNWLLLGVLMVRRSKCIHILPCAQSSMKTMRSLKLIQKAMEDPAREPQARLIYETVGVYLGYGLAQYCEFYKIEHVMILGRVSKGKGGDLMLEKANEVLSKEFPELPAIKFHTADDHFKAVGQCIAAAALPEIQ